ncbi:glycosyl hydrolase [Hymenobacter sp. CRA2]|uniref:glycosyl hydrolase n=1 Tax=Hymenobacter sp. CRA2 TaxID=1955620 RepID=UPI00098FAE48|nr:glycosyl hydrolase [Hymenobacter sp. CRA2]OON67165.1 hypothetical protein B0919_18730 [Hymenobacter sp. CRA2]
MRKPLPSRSPGRFPSLAAGLLAGLSVTLPLTPAQAQIVAAGSGSYTTVFPGTDVAGRNAVPMGTSPLVSGAAATKPVPTNDFWSAKLQKSHVGNIFNYPSAYRTDPAGLGVNRITPNQAPLDYRQPNSNVMGVLVGVQNLNATAATVSNFSDWTVTMNWRSGSNDFSATLGMGMPFTYFTKAAADVAQVKVAQGTATVNGEMLLVLNTFNNADFVVYAPAGATWTLGAANTYTSTLGGKTYWSMVHVPDVNTSADLLTQAQAFKKFAYVFPANTQVAWQYNETSAVLTSTFTVTPDRKEGTANNVAQGLLPHQWGHLAAGSAQPQGATYPTVRGALKLLDGNVFSTANTFRGLLPTLPYLANYSAGFSPVKLNTKVKGLQNSGLAEWTDSYNEGQDMNKLLQTARIAHETGNVEARDKLVATIKTRLENWLTASAGEKAFIFYYNNTWKTMIGYPAGHNQDYKLNDHHFHWGYFIQAATLIEQYQPGWAAQWKPMISLLIRDAANPSRTDADFPFLRSFDPYAGHAWADGFAMTGDINTEEPQGNNQESTPESMQFNSALIHWGAITGDKAIRDLGIYLYTTEQSAAEEYWFDTQRRTFQPNYPYASTGRIWGSGYDAGTWWTQDVRAMYGIQLYPIHGGSFYLGRDTTYVRRLWNDMVANTGILQNEVNPNLWHDVLWQYLAFIDPARAIRLYDNYPNRGLKTGISDAQTYYWLHAMNALGALDGTVTANSPLAAVFRSRSGQKTYVAHNYGSTATTVTFSDGYVLNVPARKTATSRDVTVSGTLAANAVEVVTGGSVTLTASVSGAGVTGVEFFDGPTSLGRVNAAPFVKTASSLPVGIHTFYAKVYAGTSFSVTNLVSVQVGKQASFTGTPQAIPGTIEAGRYDTYPGGSGQDIAYSDVSEGNQATYEPAPTQAFRPDQGVDAVLDPAEGATVGWVDAGEWLEYTVNVAQAGTHTLNLRYAAGNAGGGGPFFLSVDGTRVSPDQTVTTTSNWGTWATKTITGLSLPAGEHVLRLTFTQGGLNVGRLAFTYTGAANTPPTVSLTSPANNASFTAPASITISANAADANGTVSKVEFFQGSTKLSEDTSSPYSFTWSSVAAGTYSITARATDNGGATTTSSAVSVTVNPGGPTAQAIPGKIEAESFSAQQGTDTEETSDTGGGRNVDWFETGDWLDYYVNVAQAGTYTVGFRVASANGGATFQLRNSGGTVLGSINIGNTGNWQNWQTISTNVTLPAGPQTLRVYASASTGCNLNWLNFAAATTTNTPPTVSLTSPSAGASFTAPASITISANAADANGTVSKVEFFQGSTKLGEDTSSPYSFTWSNVAAGSYSITARATDNAGATTTSSAVNVTVTSSPSSGYCAVVSDFSYGAVSSGGNVTFTFHPLGATAGGSLAIIYLREGSAGGYPGYTMTKNAAGDFTFTKAIATGTVTSIYFTYQVGAGGPERNTAASPFSYTVGQSCNLQARMAGVTSSSGQASGSAPERAQRPGATEAAVASPLQVTPNPAYDRATIQFALAPASAYTLEVRDLSGRLVRTFSGSATEAARVVALEMPLETHPAGVYVLHLRTGGQTQTQRLVLLR